MQLPEAFARVIVKLGTVPEVVGKPAAVGTLPSAVVRETSAELEMSEFPCPCAPVSKARPGRRALLVTSGDRHGG